MSNTQLYTGWIKINKLLRIHADEERNYFSGEIDFDRCHNKQVTLKTGE